MTRLAIYAAILAGLILAVGVYGHWRYSVGQTDGRNAVLADDARDAQQRQDAQDWLSHLSTAATSDLSHTINSALPTIQGQTHDTVETIRTIYRDRPVPVDVCSRPDSVQQQLDQAVDRANLGAGS
jgi:uncharacterized protein HemX